MQDYIQVRRYYVLQVRDLEEGIDLTQQLLERHLGRVPWMVVLGLW